MAKLAVLFLVVAGSLAITSCSKSPTRSAAGPPVTVTLTSEAALDGWVQSDGIAHAPGGGPITGDFDSLRPGVGFRQFFSFDLSAIPAGAVIDSASLRLYQANVLGQPYAGLGDVIVDQVDLGPTLDASDYAASPIAPNIGTLSGNIAVGYRTLDVTARVAIDRSSARRRSQYRLRFSIRDSDNDGQNDLAQFTDAEDSCCGVNRPPQLVVVYHQ